MDTLTQVALGTAVGHAALGARVGRKALLWGAVFGAMPDLDVFLPQADDLAAVTNHRSFSHSLITHSIAAPVFGAGLSRLHSRDGVSPLRWTLLVWLALTTHALLDSITVYGTQLLWPFESPPIGLGSIFIIDPVYTLLLLVGVTWATFSRRGSLVGRRANALCLGLSTAYLAAAIFIQAQVQGIATRELARQNIDYQGLVATPTPFNLVLWRIVAMSPDGYREGYYSLLDRTNEVRFSFHPSDYSLLVPIEDTPAVKRLDWFVKGFYRVREVEGRVEMTDLRMGYEPHYVFSFFVGYRHQGTIHPLLPPERAAVGGFDSDVLRWIWLRMIGEADQFGPVRNF